jgi:hypothetical protein
MGTRRRLTFDEILREEAPRTTAELEAKARTASRLAKIQLTKASTLYSLKNRAIRQLFRIPGQMPFIRDAWTTHCGLLLSIRLTRTGSFLHFPFEELNAAVREFYGPWVARRARGKRWEPMPGRPQFATRGTEVLRSRGPR